MVYVKEKLADGVEIRINITDENVFSKCPTCGRELPMGDLGEVSEYDTDIFDPKNAMFCSPECIDEWTRLYPHLKHSNK